MINQIIIKLIFEKYLIIKKWTTLIHRKCLPTKTCFELMMDRIKKKAMTALRRKMSRKGLWMRRMMEMETKCKIKKVMDKKKIKKRRKRMRMQMMRMRMRMNNSIT